MSKDAQCPDLGSSLYREAHSWMVTMQSQLSNQDTERKGGIAGASEVGKY